MILSQFTRITDIQVQVVSSGTGQALRNAMNGDADVVLVHSKSDEEKFVAEGYGIKRYELMYNNFVIVGPLEDPADVKQAVSVLQAFLKISETESPFLSRGDDSGTHKREMQIWNSVDISDSELDRLPWYVETGSGMGATLTIAIEKDFYTLSDRGTWINYQRKGTSSILYEDDKGLLNIYGVILVNDERHPHVKSKEGQILIDWLISKEGQRAINSYRANGEQLFFAIAH
jgi:tungstate transport system substrate-binding protein